jgi:hypothetical protein
MRSLVPLLVMLLASSIGAPAQWTLQDSGTTADLRGIDSAGNGVAWASGTHGTVLRTLDGGAHWLPCAVPPGGGKLDFRGIQAFDANTAIVMSSGPGDLSRLYKTTDGCASWKLVFTNPDKDGFWDAIRLRKSLPQDGNVIGDPIDGRFPIFVTSDAGSTWRRWKNPNRTSDGWDKEGSAKAEKGASLFAASNQSMLFWGEGAFLFVTGGPPTARLIYADEGHWCSELGLGCSINFPSQKLSAIRSGPTSGAFAVACKSPCSFWPLKLMVVGGDYQRPDESTGNALFVRSRDEVHIPFSSYFDLVTPSSPPHGYRSAVAYDADLKIWITVGPNGTDVSSDDGRNWRAVHPDAALHEALDADRNWNALSLPFVVGPQGRIGMLDPQALGTSRGK